MFGLMKKLKRKPIGYIFYTQCDNSSKSMN